jgi:hypothetical protein
MIMRACWTAVVVILNNLDFEGRAGRGRRVDRRQELASRYKNDMRWLQGWRGRSAQGKTGQNAPLPVSGRGTSVREL